MHSRPFVSLAFPLVAAGVLAAAALTLPASAGDCGRPAPAAGAAEEPVPDDAAQPLDPSDPRFARKYAQRHRAWGHDAARDGAAR